MYNYYKKNRLILYLVLAVVTITVLLASLIYEFDKKEIYYLLYPYGIFLIIWSIIYYYDLKLRPQSWLYRLVKVIDISTKYDIPEKIPITTMKEKTGRLLMDFIKKIDGDDVLLYPKLEKIHTKNKYKITSIYEPWAVVKDLSGRSFTVHLDQLEPYIQKKDDSK